MNDDSKVHVKVSYYDNKMKPEDYKCREYN